MTPTDSAASLSSFFAAWPLFRDPLLCAVVAGAALGFLGVYVVLRRMVFVSAAVTQASALGVALAFFAEIHLGFHVDPLVGAGLLALLSTLALAFDHRKLKIPRESLLGLAFALTGGATVLVGDRIAQEAHDIQAILFGSAVLVRPVDLAAVTVTAGAVLALHVWWFRGLTFASFDPEAARVQGLPVRVLNGFVLVSVAATVGVAARALGALPVFAFCALPATTALVLGLDLPWAFASATLLGALAGGAGYLFAFMREFPVGGSQTVVASALLLVALAARFALRLLRRLRG
jgi:zinc transport system permease protein